MTAWKSAAFAGALVIAGGAGGARIPAAHGQSADVWIDDEPIFQKVPIFGSSSAIGVSIRDVEDSKDAKDSKEPNAGVVVEDVASNSAAEKAGIRTGDAIVEFDGERVRSVRQLTRLVQETPVGRKVPVVLMRGGQRVNVTVAPERRSGLRARDDFRFYDGDREFSFRVPEPPTPPPAPKARPFPPAVPVLPEFGFSYRRGYGRLGITVEDLSDGLREYFGVKHGALVRAMTDDSPAAKAGLKAGDVITAVNGTEVDDPSDITRALDRAEDEAEFTLEIVRDKKTQTLKGKLEPRQRVRSRTRTVA